MANQNGQLILQALQNIDEPATITKIVTHIADTAGVHPNDVKESVQETLNGGVRYGYIQRTNRKYYAAPVELDTLAVDEGDEPDCEGEKEENNKDTGELEDRSQYSSRRRSSSSSRSSRSRKAKSSRKSKKGRRRRRH